MLYSSLIRFLLPLAMILPLLAYVWWINATNDALKRDNASLRSQIVSYGRQIEDAKKSAIIVRNIREEERTRERVASTLKQEAASAPETDDGAVAPVLRNALGELFNARAPD